MPSLVASGPSIWGIAIHPNRVLNVTMFCTSCGKENADAAAFCSSCGARIICPDPQQDSPPPALPPPKNTSPQTQASTRCFSPWWFAYFAYVALLAAAIKQREIKPESVIDPLYDVPGLIGLSLLMFLLPGCLVVLYVFAKAVAARTTGISVSSEGVIAFLSAAATALAFLMWLGARY